MYFHDSSFKVFFHFYDRNLINESLVNIKSAYLFHVFIVNAWTTPKVSVCTLYVRRFAYCIKARLNSINIVFYLTAILFIHWIRGENVIQINQINIHFSHFSESYHSVSNITFLFKYSIFKIIKLVKHVFKVFNLMLIVK